MSDVFISYKREDSARVTPIVEGLRKAGISVWLDVETPGGASWRQAIAEKLQKSRCVLVLWSKNSVGAAGEFVHDEAARGRNLGILLPVRIDDVSPPLGFGEIQSLDLVGWRGRPRDPRFGDVVAAVKATIAGEPRPRPTAPGQRRRRVALAGAAAMAVSILGVWADVAGLQYALCRLPGVYRVCGTIGLGGIPSQAEETIWASRSPGDCAVLRQYVHQFPNGAYAEEAQRRLEAKTTEIRVSWSPEEKRLPLTVRQALSPFPNEVAARQEAISRGIREARILCNPLETGGLFRLVSAAPDVRQWHCRPHSDGLACGFDGEAVCEVEAKKVKEMEVCP